MRVRNIAIGRVNAVRIPTNQGHAAFLQSLYCIRDMLNLGIREVEESISKNF